MVSEGVVCWKDRDWAKKSSQGKGAERDLIEELVEELGQLKGNRSLGVPYLLGLSNSFWLGDGTMVPVDDVDEAEEDESFGDSGGRGTTSSCGSSGSSRSSKTGGASGGSLARCARANAR